MTAIDTAEGTPKVSSENSPLSPSLNLVNLHKTQRAPSAESSQADRQDSSTKNGGIFSGIANEFKNLVNEVKADPLKTAIDFTTPLGLIDHFAGTNIAGFESDLIAGAAKEAWNNPGKLAVEFGVGLGVGAVTAATSPGWLVAGAITGTAIVGSELWRNRGNGISGEINGAINDVHALISGVRSLGNDAATVLAPGSATTAQQAAADQGIENVGAWMANTAAFTAGSLTGAVIVKDALAAARAGALATAGADVTPPQPGATPPPGADTPPSPPVPPKPGQIPPPGSTPPAGTDMTPKPGTSPIGTDVTPQPGTSPMPGPDAIAKPGSTPAPGVDGSAQTGSTAVQVADSAPPVEASPKLSAGADGIKATAPAAAAGSENFIVVNGITVSGPPGVDLQAAVNSKQFSTWINNLDPQIEIKNVEIQNVDMFGKNVGFVKFKADAINAATGKPIPGIVFARGDSVGILPVLVGPDNQEYAVMVTQPRVPIGQANYTEIPAGMQNPDDSIVGTAIKEIKEETGMTPTKNNLITLGDIYPSPGGSDERISLYALRQNVTQQQLDDLNGRIAGVASENEQTTVKIVPLQSLRQSTDAKAVSALAKYDGLTEAEKQAGTTTFGTE